MTISPGGRVVTWGYSYQLGDLTGITPMPPLPRGFVGAGSNRSAINDNGDQAHMLVSTSSQNLRYPFRLSRGGTWQQISSAGSGNLSASVIGSIHNAQDVTFTVPSTAMIAAGPAGTGQSLSTLVSPDYPGVSVGGGVGAIAFRVEGATLATRTLDRTRGTLANYVIPSVGPPPNQAPVARFTYSCNNSTRACSFNGSTSRDDVGITSYRWTFGDGSTGTGVTAAHTYAAAGSYPVALTVTDGAGLTNAVTQTVTLTSTTTNLPPVASWSATCLPAPAHQCTLNGTASRDPDGSIVANRWTRSNRKLLSNLAIATVTFEVSGTRTFTLTVTDNTSATNALTKSVVVPFGRGSMT